FDIRHQLQCYELHKEFAFEVFFRCDRLTEKDGKLTLESSYEMVFLPYEEDVRSFAPIQLNGIVLGYRILQTRGYLPADYYNNLPHDYDSMRYIVDLFTSRNDVAKKCEVKGGNFIDVYKLAEFQSAEESFFIDNQMPYSFGPSCPDRMLCYNTHFNVLSHLMDDVDCIVYEHYHRGKGDAQFGGNLKFPVSKKRDLVRVTDGYCSNTAITNGDYSECTKSFGPASGMGDCRYCPHFYPDDKGLFLEIRTSRKKEVDDDSSFLLQMIEIVRKGKGCGEDIAAAVARLQGSAYRYAAVYNSFLEREEHHGTTKKI
ncbi:MAG: hypothetical protein J5959_17205, partial [Butyrivibrio sp.]|nr:hypothetical protein [Butyrivibrio sp.]